MSLLKDNLSIIDFETDAIYKVVSEYEIDNFWI